MKFLNETKEEMYNFEVDLDPEEAKWFRDFGLREIEKDEEALINYAVNFILREQIEQIEKENEKLQKEIEENEAKG